MSIVFFHQVSMLSKIFESGTPHCFATRIHLQFYQPVLYSYVHRGQGRIDTMISLQKLYLFSKNYN